MTHLRPIDMPQLRAELLEHYRNPLAEAWWAEADHPPAWCIFDDNGDSLDQLSPTGAERLAFERELLEKAELFHVNRHMSELAMTAARTLPRFTLEEFDMPADAGLIFFEEPLRPMSNEFSWDFPVVACSWITVRDWQKWAAAVPPEETDHRWAWYQNCGSMIWMTWYVDTAGWEAAALATHGTPSRDQLIITRAERSSGLPIMAIANAAWFVGADNLGDAFHPIMNMYGATLRSAWLLMKQTLASITEVEPDRAARRRLSRLGRAVSLVRVVTLRRIAHGDGDGDRIWHHQWIVRGHWRKQWFPSVRVHRPVWVAPYLKGPDGAPLIGGEKVYALRR